MTPSVISFDQIEDSYVVHTRRDQALSRPPRRESPRFAKRRGNSRKYSGIQQRGNKCYGL